MVKTKKNLVKTSYFPTASIDHQKNRCPAEAEAVAAIVPGTYLSSWARVSATLFYSDKHFSRKSWSKSYEKLFPLKR